MAAVPRITGGGLPEVEPGSGDFAAPLVVHGNGGIAGGGGVGG